MIHNFDTNIAEKYGINAAIILQNIYYWIEKNRANDKHFHDGYYWTYNSMKAFEELFPYMSKKQIRGALEKLEEDGIIVCGNYNNSTYDRTKWYAITEVGYELFQEGKCIVPKGQMESSERANGFTTEGKPIPNNKPDNKTNNNICAAEPHDGESANGEWEEHTENPEQEERISRDEQLRNDFEIIYGIYPKKRGRTVAFANYKLWVGKGKDICGKKYRLTNRQIYKAVQKYIKQQEESGQDDYQYWKNFDTLMGRQLLDYVDLEE